MDTFRFDEKFMFGVASSSTQIEGADTNNTWYEWWRKRNPQNPDARIRGCDHWNRVREDTEILKALHVQTYRMSLEWCKIEPSAGEYSAQALQHYRDEIRLLLDNGIAPLVTLHHFTEPVWFQELGGWKNPRNSDFFIRYVRHVVENLGDLVSEWVTFNEPNVYAIFGYLLGMFPPGVRDVNETFSVTAELIRTHVKLYNLIHKIRAERQFQGKTKVGMAMHFRVFDGVTFMGKRTADFVDYFFHELFVKGMTFGRMLFPLSQGKSKIRKGRYSDFLGVNYYTRNVAEFIFDPSCYFHKLMNDSSLSKSDLGWDIYPEGIYRTCKKYYQKCKLPMYITENGISDKYDNRRPNFIADHLAYLMKAIVEDIPVERYYHWSQMDNFEWNDGESAKFGLYRCDFDTQDRAPRKSAKFYARICEGKELTKDMIEEYLRPPV